MYKNNHRANFFARYYSKVMSRYESGSDLGTRPQSRYKSTTALETLKKHRFLPIELIINLGYIPKCTCIPTRGPMLHQNFLGIVLCSVISWTGILRDDVYDEFSDEK